MKQLILILFFSLTSQAATLVKTQKVTVSAAHGMAVTPDSKILLADTYNSMKSPYSWIFTAEGESVGVQGQGFSGITEIAGGYLVCDLMNSMVYKVNYNFEPIADWAVQNPWTAKLDSQGNIYALTHAGEFSKLKTKGPHQVLIDGLDAPFDFVFVDDQNVWISEQGEKAGRVALWTLKSKKKMTRTLDSKFKWQNPEGMLYLEGKLWVVETELGLLLKVDQQGQTETVLKDLGIPILIKKIKDQFVIYSNKYKQSPSLLFVKP